MIYRIRVRADFSDTIEVEADNFEEAEGIACQKFLDEFDTSTMSMFDEDTFNTSLDTEEVNDEVRSND